jgi:hypothetical protein
MIKDRQLQGEASPRVNHGPHWGVGAKPPRRLALPCKPFKMDHGPPQKNLSLETQLHG